MDPNWSYFSPEEIDSYVLQEVMAIFRHVLACHKKKEELLWVFALVGCLRPTRTKGWKL